MDVEGNRIYSNKPLLAKRIIAEIQSLYPAICPDCSEEYSNEFDSDTAPATRCFLCLIGCHDCASFEPSVSSATSVWLCKACYDNNKFNKSKKPKSKPANKTASKVASKMGSGATTPNTGNQQQSVQFSETELQDKLDKLIQEERANNTQHNTITADNLQRPNLKPDEICDMFKVGKCPHGISGKNSHNGQAKCKMYHPKRCIKFIRNGTHKKFGCKRGTKCMFFHPKHCPTSLSDKFCYAKDCTLVHRVGTKRKKPPEGDRSYRRDTSGSRNSNTNSKSGANSRNNNPTRSRSSSQTQKKDTSSKPENEDFLEIRSLLTNFQSSFQKEIEDLKLTIANQENRIAAFLPSVNHHTIRQFFPHAPPSQHPMFHHPPVPQFQPLSHVPPHPVNWSNTQASGC